MQRKEFKRRHLDPFWPLPRPEMTAGQSSQQTQSGMCGEPIAERTSHPQTLNVEDILCELILLYFFT